MSRTYRICVIPGDGIGQEVTQQALRVLDAAASRHGLAFDFEAEAWGSDYYLAHGRMMPEDASETVASCDATLFGAVGSPAVSDAVSARGLIIRIRQELDLYLNLRPIRRVPTQAAEESAGGERAMDMLIVRENTEGEYIGVGGRLFAGTDREIATQVSIFTSHGIERAADYAFTMVPTGGLLTSVTKSNALPETLGLWDDVIERVAARHPTVRWERMHVDAVAYQMVRAPQRFDVLVASNLFGDILSDLGAGLQGSLGLASSANINPETRVGVFEPVHGSAPDIAFKGIANPIGAIRSAAMLLEFIGEASAADGVQRAVDATLRAGVATADLGGSCTTSEMGDEVLARLAAEPR